MANPFSWVIRHAPMVREAGYETMGAIAPWAIVAVVLAATVWAVGGLFRGDAAAACLGTGTMSTAAVVFRTAARRHP